MTQFPAEVLPAAPKPAQKHVSEICVSQKKAEEDAEKDSGCPELQQQAAAIRAALFWK